MLTEKTICNRVLSPQKGVEDTVADNIRYERLRQAIAELPEIQRRRFILYHEFGLTYGQIADCYGTIDG